MFWFKVNETCKISLEQVNGENKVFSSKNAGSTTPHLTLHTNMNDVKPETTQLLENKVGENLYKLN